VSMEPIYIPRLTRAPERTEVVEINQMVPGLETLTPVRGQLKVTHHGTYLEVSAQAETIMTLCCHRCLQQYNYRLAIAPSELIWLEDSTAEPELSLLDQDLISDDLLETLSPDGDFDAQTWLYEQLCLEIPQRQLCDPNCPGILPTSVEEPAPLKDSRWASLEALRNTFLNN